MQRSEMERMNTAKTAKKGGKKNGTERCKNCDSPISPNDQQASITLSGGCPLFKKIYERSEYLIGVLGGKGSHE
jgi:hypothetical protein